MESFWKPSFLIRTAIAVAVVAGAWLTWHWVICRVEVLPGYFLVKIHLWGKDLPEGMILAPDKSNEPDVSDDSYKGILRQEFPEGRYFLNPLVWAYEIHKMVEVPSGQCLVVTRRHGAEVKTEQQLRGEYLAGPGERGVVAEVRQPGNYRLNPHAYSWELVKAIEIRAEEVGVRTLRAGKDPRELKREAGQSPYVVPEGYRGVQDKPVSNGTYYVNPHVETIVPVDVRSHRVEFTDIQFPSRDGFPLQPHVFVTYKVVPAKAPELFVTLTDEGKLHQTDGTPQEQEKNEILQKVVLPLIRGYVRIEGSKFDARDFVSAAEPVAGAPANVTVNPRERLQSEVMEKVQTRCQKVGIIIESVTVDKMDVPVELSTIISDREQARITREKNLESIGQFKEQQELKAKEALKQQEEEKVAASSLLVKATAKSKQRTSTEEARLKQELANAKLRLEAAKEQAKATLADGEAEAKVIMLQNDAEISGLKKAIQGFPSADYFAQYNMIIKLAPALAEVFASDDSELSKLFTTYLTPPTGKATLPVAGSPAPPAAPVVGKK